MFEMMIKTIKASMAIGWRNALIGLLLTFIATSNREQIKSSAPKEK
jgi:hypothetical protein